MFGAVEWLELCLKRETGDDGEQVEADGKDERKQEFETGGGRNGGVSGYGEGGRPAVRAAVENLFKSHMKPEGEAERVTFIQKQQQLPSNWNERHNQTESIVI